MTRADLCSLLSPLALSLTALLIMLGIAVRRNHPLTIFITLSGLGMAFLGLQPISWTSPTPVTALLTADGFSSFFMGLLLAAGVVVTIFSPGTLGQATARAEEYYLLLVLSILGAQVLVMSSHFASFFLGLELMSLSLYGLVAYPRHRAVSIEAGLKYLILASAASAFLLFGMALVYASLGSMQWSRMAELLAARPPDLWALAGLSLMAVGIGFKLALAPFHMWTPDVYQGAAAPVTALVATVSKGAMAALLMRFTVLLKLPAQEGWFTLFTVLAVLSMVAGNLLALKQQSLKRLLAYSSISHMGYLLVALLAGGSQAADALCFYLVAYFLTQLGAFGVIAATSRDGHELDQLDDYRGFGKTHPFLSLLLAVMMLSLAGIPLTAGFVGKFLVLGSGVGSSLWILVLALVLNSAVGLFYYLRVIAALYLTPAPEEPPTPSVVPRRISLTHGLTLGFLALLLLLLGVYPTPLLTLLHQASFSLFHLF